MTIEALKSIMENPDITSGTEIIRLAALSKIDYDREREQVAERLGIRVSTLDEEVKEERGKTEETQGQGRILSLPEPKLWHEPLEGITLFNEISDTILKYVIMDKVVADAVALWIVHAHTFDAFHITPRLAIQSPEKGCGKTTLLDVIQCLTPRPLLTANVSTSVVFRTIEMARPTLLLDEGDSFLHDNEELRGLLNSGHRRNGVFLRNVGDSHEPRMFSTFAPTVIALIGKLPSTLEDRSIPISLRRRKPDEAVTQFRFDRTEELAALASKIARWAFDNRDKLVNADPVIPDGIYNRAADNWRPLLTIAEAAGEEWIKRAKEAAIKLSTITGDAEQSSIRVQLLSDIKNIFEEKGVDKLPSAELVKALIEIEDHSWKEWKNGKPLSANSLARLLSPFGIAPSSIRLDAYNTPKGYSKNQFTDTWERYLLLAIANQSATTPQSTASLALNDDMQPPHNQDCCVPENSAPISISASCGGVAVQNPEYEVEV